MQTALAKRRGLVAGISAPVIRTRSFTVGQRSGPRGLFTRGSSLRSDLKSLVMYPLYNYFHPQKWPKSPVMYHWFSDVPLSEVTALALLLH
jgi:hypothetical protein